MNSDDGFAHSPYHWTWKSLNFLFHELLVDKALELYWFLFQWIAMGNRVMSLSCANHCVLYVSFTNSLHLDFQFLLIGLQETGRHMLFVCLFFSFFFFFLNFIVDICIRYFKYCTSIIYQIYEIFYMCWDRFVFDTCWNPDAWVVWECWEE